MAKASAWKGPILQWAVLITLGLLAACSNEGDRSGLVPGDRFPVVNTLALEGGREQLQPALDKVVVINVWGTWCAPCRKELPGLQRLSEVLGAQDYAVIGIALDHDDHLVREYLRERGIGFENHLAEDAAQVQRDLGVNAVPSTFILAKGNIIARHIIGPREWDAPEMIAMIREVAERGALERVSK